MSPFDRARRALRKSLGAGGSAMLFFTVVTPLALGLRLAGCDPLRLRRNGALATYWLVRPARGGRQTAMTRQY